MPATRQLSCIRCSRSTAGLSLGLAWAVACGAAAPATDGRIGEARAILDEPPTEGPRASDAGPDGGDGGAKCPHGALEDPHHGFVRCLSPEEADAGYRLPSQAPTD